MAFFLKHHLLSQKDTWWSLLYNGSLGRMEEIAEQYIRVIGPNVIFLPSIWLFWSGMTYTGSVTFLWRYERLAWNMLVTCIQIFSGPLKVCLGFTNFWSFSHEVCAPMTVTAATVSSLKRVFRPLIPSWVVQSPPVVWSSSRNREHSIKVAKRSPISLNSTREPRKFTAFRPSLLRWGLRSLFLAELHARLGGAPKLRKSINPRKSGNHVTVHRTTDGPSTPQGNQCLLSHFLASLGAQE